MGISISAGGVCITFGSSLLEILSIESLDRSTAFCRGGRMELLIRVADQVSEPIFLRDIRASREERDMARIELVDESGDYRARVEISPSPFGLHVSVRVDGPVPIWMIEWRLCGLDLHEVIVPALGGQSITEEMPDGARLAYKYPFWWNAQFVIGTSRSDSGIWWRTMDADPHFKLLRVERRNSLFDITWGFESDAPLRVGEVGGELFLDAFEGGWQTAVDEHREWLAKSLNLVPYELHPSFPAWARDINLVLELWGMRRDIGLAVHTFDEMAGRIEEFSKKHPPSETLLYLPGFSHGGIDSKIPDYAPGEKLGGAEGFARLVDAAHSLGYRVMIHTNVLGMVYNHPLYPRFKDHQVVDVFERPQGWAMDLDGDWLTEPYFAYINPGSPQWSELMTETLGNLIREFDLDGVFLDQTLLAFNVSLGPNFVSGMRSHVERLQQAFPDVLFAGEGINEHVLPALPMVQIHGIDSIAGVHGMEDASPWRRVHPVSSYLFAPHTLFVAHLLTKHPSHPAFRHQEAAYRELGVIPALVCYNRDQELRGSDIDAVVARAKHLGTRSVGSHERNEHGES